MNRNSPIPEKQKSAREILDEKLKKRGSISKPIQIEREGQLVKKGSKRWFVLTADTHMLFWFSKPIVRQSSSCQFNTKKFILNSFFHVILIFIN